MGYIVHKLVLYRKKIIALRISFFNLVTRCKLDRKCFFYKSNLDISKVMWLFFTSSNYPKCKLIALRVIWTCKKISDAKLWLEKAIKMYFWFRKTLRVSQNSRYPSSRYWDSTVFLQFTLFILTVVFHGLTVLGVIKLT